MFFVEQHIIDTVFWCSGFFENLILVTMETN